MQRKRAPADATMLDLLVDGFEKNEVIGGFHWRTLPLPDEAEAERKFESFLVEAECWKGPPERVERGARRRVAVWPDLELRQAGRGVAVLVAAPGFHSWWHEPATWAGDPMRELHEWLFEATEPGRNS